jgi:hypothetical protein
MSDNPSDILEAQSFQQSDFEKISQLVSAEFQIEESIMDQGVPTYYLKWPQETKQAFLRLLNKLGEMNLIAFLRKVDGRIVLKVAQKPPVKPSNPTIYWVLFLATVGTTFATGYFSFQGTGIDPIVSGAIFSASILTVLGLHEMGHKITANRKKIEATSPYFIPGLPPLGTFGAVIMQKSLPPNKDALFEIGANGPISGFIVAVIFSIVGLMLLVPGPKPSDIGELNLIPSSWILLESGLSALGWLPQALPGEALFLHPITWAGWAGMVVTMLNLLPAAMLDGGHVARSLMRDKFRWILTAISVGILIIPFYPGNEFLFMAFLVVFMSMFRHPGPLDDVSGLSRGKKFMTVALVAVFILSFPVRV